MVIFGFKFGKDGVLLRRKCEKCYAANYHIVNVVLKRTNPTWLNNNINCQKTNVCGGKKKPTK